MILTRLKLNLRSVKTLKALGNAEVFHAALEASQESGAGRLLWRVDLLNNCRYLLVLSQDPLNTELLERQFGFPEEPAQQKSYDRLLDRVREDSVWQFRLTANPTFSVMHIPGEKRGKRKPCLTEKRQLEWIEKQSVKHGFALMQGSVKIMENIPITVRKKAIIRCSCVKLRMRAF